MSSLTYLPSFLVSNKSLIYSPSSKNKVNKATVATKKMIERLTQRLFHSKPVVKNESSKTMAELINEFHHKTRVYDNKENPAAAKVKAMARVIPRSPKLLSVKRNRARTALSHLEQEEMIGENIRKNTFKANPINKKLFEKSMLHPNGHQPQHHQHHISTANHIINSTTMAAGARQIRLTEFNLRTNARLEARKVKEDVKEDRFVFKARPMPHFKPITVQMRPLKKQSSDQQLKHLAEHQQPQHLHQPQQAKNQILDKTVKKEMEELEQPVVVESVVEAMATEPEIREEQVFETSETLVEPTMASADEASVAEEATEEVREEGQKENEEEEKEEQIEELVGQNFFDKTIEIVDSVTI